MTERGSGAQRRLAEMDSAAEPASDALAVSASGFLHRLGFALGALSILPTILLSSLPAGEVFYRVVDPAGTPIPARLSFLAPDGKTAAKLDIKTRLPHWASRGGEVYTLPSEVGIPVPEGSYRVYVSHGFEWTIAIGDVVIAKDAPARVEAKLERVVDTRGYLSADLHLHTLTFSGHGDTNVEERVITLCAEEVEWAVATDHNHNTDYLPYVDKLGARRWIHTTVGNEVTTTLLGHFNAFPFDPARPVPDFRITDPRELFRHLRAEGAQVVQVNHPRWTGSRGAYYRDVDVSPWTGDSSNPIYSEEYDAFEVLNGGDLAGWSYEPEFGTGNLPAFDYSVRDDWFNLLNRGLRHTAVGNSDSHHVHSVIGGSPRNFIRSSTDDPTAARPEELMAAIRAGDLTVSAGILVEARAEPAPGEAAIAVRVQAAPWIRADRWVVVANGEEIAVTPLAQDPERRRVLRYEGVFRHRPRRDTWYVVYASGDEAPVPMQHASTFPLGFTNPMWIDIDGDGAFTPLREHARRAIAAALAGADPAALLAEEGPFFRRQAVGAVADLAAAGAEPDAVIRVLRALLHDASFAVRRGAAELLARRTERSALLALLEARAGTGSIDEQVALDFELVRSGHLPALDSLAAADRRLTGLARSSLRRDVLELTRRTRIGPWRVHGPYSAPSWEAGLGPAPPEPRGEPGRADEAWRLSTVDKKSYLNLRETMDPRLRAGAYASLRVRAREALRTCILVQSTNALRLFCGGREVHRQGPSAKASWALVPVAFPAGESEILLQCVVESGAWGLQLGCIDPQGVLTLGDS